MTSYYNTKQYNEDDNSEELNLDVFANTPSKNTLKNTVNSSSKTKNRITNSDKIPTTTKDKTKNNTKIITKTSNQNTSTSTNNNFNNSNTNKPNTNTISTTYYNNQIYTTYNLTSNTYNNTNFIIDKNTSNTSIINNNNTATTINTFSKTNKFNNNTNNLLINSETRIIKRNLAYVTGLEPHLSKEDILNSKEYFGQYGKITKIVIYRLKDNPKYSAFITYKTIQEASLAILSVDQCTVNGKVIRVSFGTTKYCTHFKKGEKCPNKSCWYVHESEPKTEIIYTASFSLNQIKEAVKYSKLCDVSIKEKLFKNKDELAVFPNAYGLYKKRSVMVYLGEFKEIGKECTITTNITNMGKNNIGVCEINSKVNDDKYKDNNDNIGNIGNIGNNNNSNSVINNSSSSDEQNGSTNENSTSSNNINTINANTNNNNQLPISNDSINSNNCPFNNYIISNINESNIENINNTVITNTNTNTDININTKTENIHPNPNTNNKLNYHYYSNSNFNSTSTSNNTNNNITTTKPINPTNSTTSPTNHETNPINHINTINTSHIKELDKGKYFSIRTESRFIFVNQLVNKEKIEENNNKIYKEERSLPYYKEYPLSDFLKTYFMRYSLDKRIVELTKLDVLK